MIIRHERAASFSTNERCFTYTFQLVESPLKALIDDMRILGLALHWLHTYHAMSGMNSRNSHK